MSKFNSIDLLCRTINILSHHLMMLSNDTEENWRNGAFTQALWELSKEDEVKENENGRIKKAN